MSDSVARITADILIAVLNQDKDGRDIETKAPEIAEAYKVIYEAVTNPRKA